MITVKVKIPEKQSEKMAENDENNFYIPKRYIITFLGFMGLFNVYAMRVNLSVAMVAMVNNTKDTSLNNSLHVLECSNLIDTEHKTEEEQFVGEQYSWSAKTQGLILGAFFYGYIVTQIPGGFFSEKFGAKWLFGGGILVTAILSLLTPLAADWGIVPFVIVRVLEGLGEGVTFPAVNAIISRWAPKLERSRVSTIIYTGGQIGNVVSMPISGWLSSSATLGGWPSVFYTFGAVGCVWFIFWAVFVHETPSEHPSITKDELKYFEVDKDENPQKNLKTPWKSIFTSIPMWAVIIAHFGHNFGFLILLTELPTYLSTILHFDVEDNGLISALPYIVQAVTAWMASYVADRLRTSNVLSITGIRKVFNTVGLIGPGICLLCITFAGCRPQLTVALFTMAMALNGCIYSGFNVTHVDMSPDFAGTMFGITNAISNLCGIIAPALVGAFTNSGATIANWSKVFYIATAMYAVTGVFFAIFASAELQPWGKGKEEPNNDLPFKDIRITNTES